MIRGKLLQIGVKAFVAMRQCGAPLFRLDARRTLFLQLLLKTSFCHFDLGTEMAEIAQQDILTLQYNIELAGKLWSLLDMISEAGL